MRQSYICPTGEHALKAEHALKSWCALAVLFYLFLNHQLWKEINNVETCKYSILLGSCPS